MKELILLLFCIFGFFISFGAFVLNDSMKAQRLDFEQKCEEYTKNKGN